MIFFDMTVVEFYEPSFSPASDLTYSIIIARHRGLWMLVRHHDRVTWEVPAGHIESNESSDEAASRELMEETGALDFKIDRVATYSVTRNGTTGFGRLYFAEVFGLGPILDTTEIAEMKLMDSLPGNLTHPEIQPKLFKRVLDWLSNPGS